ncbi:unnamed protein product [Prunus armeniaca]
MSSSRCVFQAKQLFIVCPCVPWKEQYLLVSLLSGSPFNGCGLLTQAKLIASLACPLSRLIFLLNRLLCGDSISERVAFCGHEDLYQSLAGSDGQLAIQVLFSWKAFLESRGCDSVVTSYSIGLFCFESLDVVLKGFVRLLAQVV